jgi:SAM-dependent methyltransferase
MATVLKRIPPPLLPAWPDLARKTLQRPVFAAAMSVAPPRGVCLDAGSGKSGTHSHLLEVPAVTEIVDFDLKQPEVSRIRQDPRHRDVQGSIASMPFGDSSFDWILVANVLPWVEDDHAAISELARVLKPGGDMLISVGTDLARRDIGGRLYARPGYSLQALADLCASADLQITWHRSHTRLSMHVLHAIWRWQYERLGRGRRSLMPRFAVLAFGWADKWLRIGDAWGLTVVAQKP